ncbi:MAG: tRNA 2-thiouridine(34) synthase MnmA [Candidatus Kapaibacterium sp.]
MQLDKNKVLLGMSGGVDSSVAAALLKQQGYEVVGMTFIPFHAAGEYEGKFESDDYIRDAADICARLGIRHEVVDFSEKFREVIIEYFIDEYLRGRTPNPCTKCNPEVKFRLSMDVADEFGAYFVATGHYLRKYYNEDTGRFVVQKGKDERKDQSYVLWGLSQRQIARAMFPLGNYSKPEIRELARQLELSVHAKPESQEICFIKDNDYHGFLMRHAPKRMQQVAAGDIVFRGETIGRHEGIPFYTIGQRKGLGISHKEPLYVCGMNRESNVIEVGTGDRLESSALIAEKVNLIKYKYLDEPRRLSVKIRYNDPGAPAECHTENGRLVCRFDEPRRAITPGQSVVMYEGDDLVGGGIIGQALD